MPSDYKLAFCDFGTPMYPSLIQEDNKMYRIYADGSKELLGFNEDIFCKTHLSLFIYFCKECFKVVDEAREDYPIECRVCKTESLTVLCIIEENGEISNA